MNHCKLNLKLQATQVMSVMKMKVFSGFDAQQLRVTLVQEDDHLLT